MAFIDLTTARARVEGTLLTDTCVITRNPSEFRDAGFDETTGDYIPPGTETPIVYGPGICAIAEQSRSEMTIAGAGRGEGVRRRAPVGLPDGAAR